MIELTASTTRSPIVPTATGVRLGTVTTKPWTASRPPGSRAVTVTPALPLATPVSVRVSPATTANTRPVSAETAEYSSESRSGSAKNGATASAVTLSTSSTRSSIESTAAGARFGTVTANPCATSNPPGSRAVTVTVVLPTAIPVTVTVLAADIATVARVVSDETAAYASSWPSGSAKYAAASSTSRLSTNTSLSGIVSATAGARFGIVTTNSCSAVSPSVSAAVTVTVAAPTATPVTTTTPPATATTARVVSDETATYTSESPSGSVKCAATSISIPSPTNTSWPVIASRAMGVRFGTVTPKCCSASSPPGSRAITVTPTLPFATPVSVRVSPATTTATRPESAVTAEYSSESRSGSAKKGATAKTATLSTSSTWSPIESTAAGAWFGTVTANSCATSSPPGSRAVTVTVVLPTAIPATVTVLADTATVARVVSDETAAYASSSPSGSAKNAAASSTSKLSTNTSPSGIVSATTGTRFGTVTAKLCVAARLSGSRAVTVTIVSPAARPVTRSALPDTVAVAVSGAPEIAV